MELLLFISVHFWSIECVFHFFFLNCLQVDKVGESAAEVGFVECFRGSLFKNKLKGSF